MSGSAAGKNVPFIDTQNPALGLDCPSCGLWTARFGWFCRNCGFGLWPNARAAARAFQVWRAADISRAYLRPYEDTLPVADDSVIVVDFGERAHHLGIHLFPPSAWPFIVCVGALFLGFAAIPFDATVRTILAVLGALVFIYGVAGWMLEDVRLYPVEEPGDGHGEVHQ